MALRGGPHTSRSGELLARRVCLGIDPYRVWMAPRGDPRRSRGSWFCKIAINVCYILAAAFVCTASYSLAFFSTGACAYAFMALFIPTSAVNCPVFLTVEEKRSRRKAALQSQRNAKHMRRRVISYLVEVCAHFRE